jgi:hypothetical protein
LHGVDSVAANDRGRALNVDASEFGGVREECVGGQVDAGGDGAAEVLAVFGEGVEVVAVPKSMMQAGPPYIFITATASAMRSEPTARGSS